MKNAACVCRDVTVVKGHTFFFFHILLRYYITKDSVKRKKMHELRNLNLNINVQSSGGAKGGLVWAKPTVKSFEPTQKFFKVVKKFSKI